ncbi:hypothetical protein GH714_042148 [Hevea brasiliensis]|uniref:Uncharacterized protein n=1 Tax=Hevea brasiliensis TaxID=3981 RepID=A0A6A6MUQ3_HEVBR|nr:hypothetical protein GH714_042148 [Hevea brasiliensis]
MIWRLPQKTTSILLASHLKRMWVYQSSNQDVEDHNRTCDNHSLGNTRLIREDREASQLSSHDLEERLRVPRAICLLQCSGDLFDDALAASIAKRFLGGVSFSPTSRDLESLESLSSRPVSVRLLGPSGFLQSPSFVLEHFGVSSG